MDIKFATKKEIKIKNQKLIFDNTTTELQYVDIGQYEKGKYSPFNGLFKTKITDVVFTAAQPNLQYLDLSYQPIKKLVLKNCPNLQKLYLYNCGLEELVFEGNFPKLEMIDVSKNKLTKIALAKNNFPALQNFFISGNPIKDIGFLSPFILQDNYFDFGIAKCEKIINPPKAILEQGNEAIRDFYHQQSKYGKAIFYEAKIIIVGEGESGKTTFRRLLFDRTIRVPEIEENQPSTHGIEVKQNKKFKHLHKENTEITANIWDFGGQHIQYNLHHYFLSPDALYVLVTDLRSEKTRFTYWFQAINFFGSENVPLIILKNEGKLDGSNDINIEQYKRDFPKLAINIDEVRINLSQIKEEQKSEWNNLVGYIIPEQLEKLSTVGTEGIKIWSDIRNVFSDFKDPYVEFDNLFSIVKEKGMDNKDDFIFMLNYFHHSGIIVYYENDDNLSSYVFVKPNWITENLYSAITEKDISNNGIFEKEKLFDFWNNKGITERKEKNILLQLMQKDKFDVAYSLGNGKYAVPILFLDKEKAFNPFGLDILRFKYKFESFMPEGILSRFIVRIYEDIEHDENGDDLAWKNGVVLKKHNTRALVIEHTDNKISVELEGEDKIHLRSIIINTFEKLFEKYPQKPELLIPCNCEKCTKSAKLEFFTYKKLLDFVNTNDSIQCQASRKMIDPSELLNGIKMIGHKIIDDEIYEFFKNEFDKLHKRHDKHDKDFVKLWNNIQKILEEFKSYSEETRTEIITEIKNFLVPAFEANIDVISKEMQEQFQKFKDEQSNLSVKAELAVPLLKVLTLGTVNIKTEVDVIAWAKKIYNKTELLFYNMFY